jgi:hypothetical protein
MSSIWGMTARASIEAACQERGQKNLVALCVQVLNGRDSHSSDRQRRPPETYEKPLRLRVVDSNVDASLTTMKIFQSHLIFDQRTLTATKRAPPHGR